MTRPMGNTEKGMARIAMDKGNWRIGSIIQLKNKKDSITVNLLRNIMTRLQERHPVLKLAIHMEGEKKQKIYWEEKASVKIPITEYHNGESSLQIWKEHASRPLKNGDGVCSIAFISGVEHSSLIILLEHLAGDASCYIHLCNEILTGIGEKEQSALHQKQLSFTPSIEECVKKTLGGKLKSGLVCLSNCLHFFSQISRAHKTFPTHPDLKSVKVKELTKNVNQIIFTTAYTADQTQKLLQFCRENNSTLTSFVSAILSDAFVKVYKNRSSESGQFGVLNNCAVSTRKLYNEPLPAEYMGCHYSFTAPITVMASGNNDLKEVISNARDYKKKTSQSITSKYPLGFSLFTGFIRSRTSDNYPANRDANLFLTNWGSLNLNQHYGEWEVIEVTPLITLTRLASISIIISSFANRLRLTMSAPIPFFNEQDLSDLHDYAKNAIKKILKNE